MNIHVDLKDRGVSAPQPPRVFPPRTLATPADEQRRRGIGPVGFSHCAFRSRDLAATRHFYEDVIGLPMVGAEKGVKILDPRMGDVPIDMIHLFFELADGSMIGFFGIANSRLEPHIFPNNALQLHFAVQMETEEELYDIKTRVTEAGYNCGIVDHDVAISLYVDDPDGIQLELCHHRPGWFSQIDLKQARTNFDEWLANGECWP